MKNIPYLLIYSRVLFAVLIAALVIAEVPEAPVWIVILMVLGLLTDVFDGIIARKLRVSTEKLRTLDSNVDQFFWLAVLGAVFYLRIEFIRNQYIWILLVLFLEVLCYAVSYWKFGRTVATHTILAKLWTLTLLAFLVALVINSQSSLLFVCCVALGVLSRLEIITIMLRLHIWATDVPSILAVSKINKGEPVKKNKLFNS